MSKKKSYGLVCLILGIIIAIFGATSAVGSSSAGPGIGLSGVSGNSVVVTLPDGSVRTLKKGSGARQGMRLIDIEGGRAAVIEVNGQQIRMVLGEAPIRLGEIFQESRGYVVSPDTNGHLFVEGMINNARIRFLVDTGASFVSISAADAKKAGIDYQQGQRRISQTANGNVPVWVIFLPELKIGNFILQRVDAAVHEGPLPIGLLGMSALKRIEMLQDGNNYILKKKY